jgi:hypothetical protein
MHIKKTQIGVYDDSYSTACGTFSTFVKVLTPAFVYSVTYRGETVLGQDLKAFIAACHGAANS